MEDEFRAATERLNEGAEIPTIEPALIECWWNVVSTIPREQRQHVGVELGAFARTDPNTLPPNPEQQVAMTFRYALLDALIERGVLSGYMEDESMREKVFAAAASLPCNKNDLGEALAENLLRDLPPERLEQVQKELSEAGYDPNHLKVGDKFIEWMHDKC